MTRGPWQVGERRGLPCAIRGRCSTRCPSRRSAAASSTRCRSMSAIAATSPASTATSMPGRTAPRKCRPRSPMWCSTSSNAVASRRSTSPAARPSSMRISAAWCARHASSACKVMDRCNLTILEQPGQEDLAEFLAANQRRGGRLDALLSAGQCRTPARQGRVRRLDPRPAEAQRARLRARSGLDAQPGLQSARAGAAAAAGRARSRLQARAGRATTASCSTSCSCSPTCRSSASAPC